MRWSELQRRPSGERDGTFRSELINASLNSGEPPIHVAQNNTGSIWRHCAKLGRCGGGLLREKPRRRAPADDRLSGSAGASSRPEQGLRFSRCSSISRARRFLSWRGFHGLGSISTSTTPADDTPSKPKPRKRQSLHTRGRAVCVLLHRLQAKPHHRQRFGLRLGARGQD